MTYSSDAVTGLASSASPIAVAAATSKPATRMGTRPFLTFLWRGYAVS